MTGIALRSQLRLSFLRYALFTVPAVLLLGTLSGALANSGYGNNWFDNLVKPALMPPGWVFGVTWTTETELPFGVRGAVRLEDQFQLHAMDLVSSLVTSLEAEGGRLFEGSRVESVDRDGDRVLVRTAAAKRSTSRRAATSRSGPGVGGSFHSRCPCP